MKNVIVTIVMGSFLVAATAFASQFKYVDNASVRIAECSGQYACSQAHKKAERTARAQVRQRAAQGCTNMARRFMAKIGKYQYMVPTMRGPGNYSRSTREYKFYFEVHCKIYRN